MDLTLHQSSPSSNLLTVVFMIGNQHYSLPVAQVVEVVRLPALLTLAGAQPHLCGLLNRRGSYLPVLDGHTLVGEPPRYDLGQQVVIVSVACTTTARLGLLVDDVRDVRSFRAAQLTFCGEGAASPLLRAILHAEDAPVLLLDADRLAELAPPIG